MYYQSQYFDVLFYIFVALQMRDTHSRSSSPIPATIIESNLYKEAHMQIDIISSQLPTSGTVWGTNIL